MRDGTPKGYAFIDFKGNEYSVRYKVVDQPETYQMEIHAPKVVKRNQGTSAGIYVNFFMGSAQNELRLRVDNGQWVKMTFVEDYDPSYMIDLYKWDTSEELLQGRRPSNPQRSTHLWRANIPTNLPAGEHTIEVEATDLFGNKHRGIQKYSIVD